MRSTPWARLALLLVVVATLASCKDAGAPAAPQTLEKYHGHRIATRLDSFVGRTTVYMVQRARA